MTEILFAALATILVTLTSQYFNAIDSECELTLSYSEKAFVFVCAMCGWQMAASQPYPIVSLLFIPYILFAAAVDLRTRSMYSIVNYIAVLGLVIAALHKAVTQPNWMEWGIPLLVYVAFIILQDRLHCYGRADVFVFIASGIYLCIANTSLQAYEALIFHLALSNVILLLCSVGNIQRKPLRLKEKAPFIPAIAISVIALI